MNSNLSQTTFATRIRGEAVALLMLGGPLIAAQLAQISMGFVDTVMAGHLSPQDLAAVAVGGSLWMPVVVFGMGVMMSVSPMVAQAFGARRFDEIGGHVRQGLWLSLAVGLVSFLIVRNCSPVLLWMRVDPAIVPTAVGFLNAVSWGLPASSAFTVLRGYSEAVSKTRPVMAISLVGLAANIAGNSIFMHGRLGMPRLGAIGTGVASACVIWIMLASLIIWILCDRYYRQFPVFSRWEGPDVAQLRTLLKLGTPIGACLFMEGSMFTTMSLLIARLGADVVAGHQIALNVASVTFMVPLGLSIAITVRVGQALGRGAILDARRSGVAGAGLAVGFMSLTALVMATCPGLIAAVYTRDSAVHATAVRLLLMAAIFQVFDGLQVASAGALRGLKDTAVPMVITFVAYWGLGLPLGIALGLYHDGGPQALWIGLIAGLAVAAVLLMTRFVFVISSRLRDSQESEKSGESLPSKSTGLPNSRKCDPHDAPPLYPKRCVARRFEIPMREAPTFQRLVEGQHRDRNPSHSPLFQVMLILQNTPRSVTELGDLTVMPVSFNAQRNISAFFRSRLPVNWPPSWSVGTADEPPEIRSCPIDGRTELPHHSWRSTNRIFMRRVS